MDTNIKEIVITEVGTRDGFQSEKKTVDTNDKVLLINDLIQAGFKRIEFSSFVSPKAIPQLADADEVIKGIKRKSDTVLTALVPNLRGAIRAVEAKIDEIVVFLSASESHNNKNLNRSIKESLLGFEEVIKLANDVNIPVHGDISTAFGCPFEGEISSQKIVEITKAYKSLGMKGVTLGDTTGMATPPVVTKAIRDIKEKVPDFEITLHFHNTRGVGLANVLVGLNEGIDHYESCFGGIGGCPFAPDATGNICTEDLVYLMHEMNIDTGIDLNKLINIAKKAERILGYSLPGQVMHAGPRLKKYSLENVPTATGS